MIAKITIHMLYIILLARLLVVTVKSGIREPKNNHIFLCNLISMNKAPSRGSLHSRVHEIEYYGNFFYNFLESVTTVQKQGTRQATENFKIRN